jgi:hypothetical protein
MLYFLIAFFNVCNCHGQTTLNIHFGYQLTDYSGGIEYLTYDPYSYMFGYSYYYPSTGSYKNYYLFTSYKDQSTKIYYLHCYSIGPEISFKISNRHCFVTGLYYKETGFNTHYIENVGSEQGIVSVTYDARIRYIFRNLSIPFYFNYKLSSKFGIKYGAEFGFLINSSRMENISKVQDNWSLVGLNAQPYQFVPPERSKPYVILVFPEFGINYMVTNKLRLCLDLDFFQPKLSMNYILLNM